MGRKATGSWYAKAGKYYAVVTVAKGKRPHVPLASVTNDTQAETFASTLADLVSKLRRAGKDDFIQEVIAQASVASEARLAGIVKVVNGLVNGSHVADKPGPKYETLVTFKDAADEWTSGRLHEQFPDIVRAIDHDDNIGRLKKHVFPLVGDVPVKHFELDHGLEVMRSKTIPKGSRRHVAQLITRVMALCVFPMRIIKTSPIPKGFLPKRARKAGSFLYPDEDAALLGRGDVPLVHRVLIGFLVREGARTGEAVRLEWSDLDLERGVVNLDKNKTDDPRAWALGRDVVAALTAWKKQAPASSLVFVETDGRPVNVEHLAAQLRAYLQRAGVTRASLFEHSDERMRLRAHDLRSTFVTLSLANGRTETWVIDRTGHTSSDMVNRYRRQARTVAELGIGLPLPMHKVIPELSNNVETLADVSGDDGMNSQTAGFQAVRRVGVEPTHLSAPEPKTVSRAAKFQESARSDDELKRASASNAGCVDAFDTISTIRPEPSGTLTDALNEAVAAALQGDETRTAEAMFAVAALDDRSPFYGTKGRAGR